MQEAQVVVVLEVLVLVEQQEQLILVVVVVVECLPMLAVQAVAEQLSSHTLAHKYLQAEL
jgi:hypothetical protein